MVSMSFLKSFGCEAGASPRRDFVASVCLRLVVLAIFLYIVVELVTRYELVQMSKAAYNAAIASAAGHAANTRIMCPSVEEEKETNGTKWPPATGCKKVYIDLGTNIGVQIRKIYEPSKFPDAPVLSRYDEEFGADRRDVCSFGFEPNPVHAPELAKVESAYRKQGWNVTILKETAATTFDGTIGLTLDTEDANNYWGASVVFSENTGKKYDVRAFDVVKWLLKTIMPLRHTADAQKDGAKHKSPVRVAMKMDVEGAEHEILPYMVLTGAICAIDVIWIEWHNQESSIPHLNAQQFIDNLHSLVDKVPFCNVRVVTFDDETFWRSSSAEVPLPE